MLGLDAWFSLFCHQMAERSPQLQGLVFPLCYRCAGLYLGLFGAYLALWGRRPGGGQSVARWAVGWGVLLVPWWLDGWGNALQLWATPGWLRAASGGLAGLGLTGLLLPFWPGANRDAGRRWRVTGALGLASLPPLFGLVPQVAFYGLAWAAFAGWLLLVRNLVALWRKGVPVRGGRAVQSEASF